MFLASLAATRANTQTEAALLGGWGPVCVVAEARPIDMTRSGSATKQMATIQAGEQTAKGDSTRMLNRTQYHHLLPDIMRESLATTQGDDYGLFKLIYVTMRNF